MTKKRNTKKRILSALVLGSIIQVLTGCASMNSVKVTIPSSPSTTSNAGNLTRETNDMGAEFYPRVSPNGKYIIYTSMETVKTANLNATNDWSNLFNQQAVTIKTNSSKVVKKEIGSQLTSPLVNEACDATWAPDGSILFSYRRPAQPVIVKTNSEGVGLNYVSQAAMGTDDRQPNMTKDGNSIIFTTLVGANRMICSMDSKGGKFTILTDGEHVSIDPVDNNKIIYNLSMNKRDVIFMMDLKTGQKTQLTSGDFDCRDGAFSNDGNWITFSSNQENPKSNNFHIYMMKTNGTEMKQLTKGDTDEGNACWGADNTIYFYSNAGNNYNIWKVTPLMQ